MSKQNSAAPQTSAKASVWPSSNKAVGMILLGQQYSNDRLHYISRIVLGLIIALTLSIVGNIVMWPNPPKYRYVPIDNSGLVLPQIPIWQPNNDDQFIVDWTVDAITRLYSFDFMNYRQQLQDARKNLTPLGWRTFEAALQESNSFNAILSNNFVLTAVPTGEGKITSQFVNTDTERYQWVVEFPMLITYRTAASEVNGKRVEGRIVSDPQNMKITVSRVSAFSNHSGLGIRSVVATRSARQ
jgi:intracellular multiplication protein IcmL